MEIKNKLSINNINFSIIKYYLNNKLLYQMVTIENEPTSVIMSTVIMDNFFFF